MRTAADRLTRHNFCAEWGVSRSSKRMQGGVFMHSQDCVALLANLHGQPRDAALANAYPVAPYRRMAEPQI